jgi:hypothetical protein
MVLRNIFFVFYTTIVTKYAPEWASPIFPMIDMGPHWRAMKAKLDTFRVIKNTNLLVLNAPTSTGQNGGMTNVGKT